MFPGFIEKMDKNGLELGGNILTAAFWHFSVV
jgi:hypothetical protein